MSSLDRAISSPIPAPGVSVQEERQPLAHPNIILAILLGWQLMLLLDATIVNVALSHIRESLSFSETSLSWVVNAYSLPFGGLLLIGGRLGDRFGRRRMLEIGVVIFTIASALGGIAESSEWLIFARILQGIGAAIAAPSTLSLIINNFPVGPERNRALGFFAMMSGIGASIGLILGGVLTSLLSWHWVFFVNVPVGIVVALLAPRFVGESERVEGKVDFAGAILVTGGVSSLVYGFIRVAENHWTDTGALIAFASAIVLLAGFLVAERTAQAPIMPFRLFQNRARAFAYLNMLLIPMGMFGVFFFLTLYLQNVAGMSPLRSGFAFIPLSLSIMVGGRMISANAARLNLRYVMMAGSLSMAAGLWLLTRLEIDSNYWLAVFPSMILIGLGAVSNFLPLSLTITRDITPADSGAASGTLQTMQQVGGSVGLAVLVTVFSTANKNALEDGKLPLPATLEGMQGGFLTAAIIALLAFAVAAIGQPRKQD